MTAIRTGLAFNFEKEFGAGPEEEDQYLPAPPNSFFTHGHNRSTNRQNAMGTKKFDYIAYGSYHGTWSWSFTADYKYLEPFLAVFEDYSVEPIKEGNEIIGYRHKFRKKDTGRVPSLCFRRVQLNKQAGGKNGDEILYIKGAVCTEFNLSVSAGQSQVNISMSGFSSDEKVEITDLESTGYRDYDGEHVSFACLFNSDSPGTNSYVGNVQALRVSVKNNAERIWATCGPIMGEYYEGITNYELTANIYSNNPLFRNRLYTGGRAANGDEQTTTTLEDGTHVSYVRHMLCKKLAPMEAMTISSFDTCKAEGETIEHTMERATYRMDILATNIVFKTMSWERGESSMLMDNLSSSECKTIEITVVSDVPDYRDTYSDTHSAGKIRKVTE